MTDQPISDQSIPERRLRAGGYDLRAIHPNLRLGTASDRYAGWIGQIYPEIYREQISSRSRKLKGRSFKERMLPVDSVEHYFRHFDVLELDFTFYRPLREVDGEPSSTYHTLSRYAEHAPSNARFFLKAPQEYFARKLRRSKGGKTIYLDNPTYLDAAACARRFIEPAIEILGERLAGILYEQEYQRVADSPSPEENIAELDSFFSELPREIQSHIELRSSHLLAPPYFHWLEDRGIGHIFSHWCWLPKIREQWSLAGERFTATNGDVVARLLTPLKMDYATAYAKTYPFDKPVDELANSRQTSDMILDVTALVYQAMDFETMINVLLNNRAYGNAPALGRAIAHRVLDEE